MPANVDTMFSVRAVPWHGLGKVIQEAPTSDVALKVAGLDWEVIQSPIYTQGNLIPNYKANIRSDTQEVLGIVTDRYTVIQNVQAFAFTDALLGSGVVRYETAGSLKNGRRVWLLARLQEHYQILGDDIDPYICFTNSHDGTSSVRVVMTPIRVVCQNTLNLALNSASRSWSTVHMGSIENKLFEAQRTLELAKRYLYSLNEKAEQLVDIKVSDTDWMSIVDTLLPPPPTEAKNITKLQMRREELYNAIHAPDLQRFKGTGWAVIGAVSDFVTHVSPMRRTNTFKENRFMKILDGDQLLDKAVKLIAA